MRLLVHLCVGSVMTIKTVLTAQMKMKRIVSMSNADPTSSSVKISSAFPVICNVLEHKNALMEVMKKTAVSTFDTFFYTRSPFKIFLLMSLLE